MSSRLVVNLLAIAFCALLLFAHGSGDPAVAGRPLSMLRDGESPIVGYALFAVLLSIGGLMLRTLVRTQRYPDACLFGLALVLLATIACTPSLGAFHLLWSFVLPLLMYAYYAGLLHAAGSPWLYAHLLVPAVLVLGTRFHSFGLWQKSLIVYFVLLISLHHALLSRWATTRRRSKRSGPLRRKAVYIVRPGKTWPRREPARPLHGGASPSAE